MQTFIPKKPAPPTNPTIPGDRLAVSAREAAVMLNVCERTIYNMASRGEIRSKRIGTRVVFPVASLHAFLDGSFR